MLSHKYIIQDDVKRKRKEGGIITEMTLIEALEKLAIISKNGLDTMIQIHENENEPITIIEAIRAIRNHTIDINETENYSIGSDGIRKVKDDGELGDFVYQVVENATK